MLAKTELPAFTDLGEILIADKNGIAHQALQAELNNALQNEGANLENGLSPADKETSEAKIKALQSASRIVDLFWHSTHTQTK